MKQVRHDAHGFYVCTDKEARHEDAGHASAGFDGRPHYATLEEASAAAGLKPTGLIEVELGKLARAEQAVAASKEAVRRAAIADAKQLQALHPDVYDIAMVLENEGQFYKLWTKPAVIETAANNDPAHVWKRWLRHAEQGLWFYRRHHCTPDWTPTTGAAELLAAYFLTVKYAGYIAELAGHATRP